MKRLFSVLFILMLCHGPAEAGHEIVVVQSAHVKPFEEAIKGFEQMCDADLNRIIISESQGVDVVREIKLKRPDLVLAVGGDALSEIKRIKDIPIVYVMVLNPQVALLGQENITGVSMNIPPNKQLQALVQTLPRAKRVGLLYDPKNTGYLVEEAQQEAAKMGIVLTAREIHHARDVATSAIEMKGDIDVFWMLPDVTVMTPETVEFLLLFSLKYRIPLLAFSEKYLDLGAFLSTGIDAFDMGAQAGDMADKILSGMEVKRVQQALARKYVVSTNLMIAGKLGIGLNLAMTSDDHNEKIVKHTLTLQ
ncbi:MAG: ABC transporter substrate-binding protein [Deltaproteobacteria bacterium]|nr:ABC transporter substrate-binding protein [Deltaproteobacteria bacterium]